MGLSMSRSVRRTVSPVASVLVVVFALLVPVTCAARQAMTWGHDACCAAMGHECGHPKTPVMECCSVDAPHGAPFTPVTTVTVNPPAAVQSLTGVGLPADSSAARAFVPVDAFHRPGSTRVYLLLSALLI